MIGHRWCNLLAALSLGLAGCQHSDQGIGTAPRSEKPSTTAGWKEVSTSGISILLPADWKSIDLSSGKLEAAMQKELGNDPKSNMVRNLVQQGARQGSIKLESFDTSTLGTNFATNCNVDVEDVHGQPTVEQVASSSVQQLSPLLAEGTKPQVEFRTIAGIKMAVIRSELKLPSPTLPQILSLAYIALHGSRIAVVTFSAPVTDEARIKPLADKAMGGFRFTN